MALNPLRAQRFSNLRHRIEPWRLEEVQDAGGGWQQEWVALPVVAARFEPLRGDERLHARQLGQEVHARVYTREGALPADIERFRYRGDEYRIEARFNPDERGRYTCHEVVTATPPLLP